MRQDPERLYTAYGASADMKSWDNRAMPKWADLGPKVQAHWTVTALAAAGLDMRHSDAALDRLARELAQTPDHKGVESLYWTVRTWSRMSASINEGARSGGPLTADAGALTRALVMIGQQHPDALISPLAPTAVQNQASGFMCLLGTLGVATAGATASLTYATAPGVILTFERIATAYDHLETAGQPRAEGDLFRSGADLVRRMVGLACSPGGVGSSVRITAT